MTDAPEKPSKVIDLAAWKRDNTPHISGGARCLNCGHEWEIVVPVGTFSLDCPKCDMRKGVFTGLVLPPEAWACLCGCVHFFITPTMSLCALCGLEQAFGE